MSDTNSEMIRLSELCGNLIRELTDIKNQLTTATDELAHRAAFRREAIKMKAIIDASLKSLPAGYLPAHTPENLPVIIDDLARCYAEALDSLSISRSTAICRNRVIRRLIKRCKRRLDERDEANERAAILGKKAHDLQEMVDENAKIANEARAALREIGAMIVRFGKGECGLTNLIEAGCKAAGVGE